MSADPLHTHKWTVAVRSAASNPLPSHVFDDNGAVLPAATPTTSTGAAAGTRGRDTETDFHKHVGGKDDISHFIRRVQFKLHDSFPQPVRTFDRPPYQVSETGWGEFEIQIKIWWAAESGEKPLQTFHYLKLHPWHPLPVSAAEVAAAEDLADTTAASNMVSLDQPAGESNAAGSEAVASSEAKTNVAAGGAAMEGVEGPNSTLSTASTDPAVPETATPKDVGNETGGETAKADAIEPTATSDAAAGGVANAVAPPPVVLPPVVHSWQYDEVVFPEPTEAFYQTLISHPPTPLPATAAQAFTDPKTSRLQHGFNVIDDGTSAQLASNTPPYPLHAPSSQVYLHGISQQSIQAEADRLDIARIEAVRELERERTRLIEAEKELRIVRAKAEALASAK